MVKKFVKVSVGSRGFIEDVDVFEGSYEDIQSIYQQHIDSMLDQDDEVDAEQMEYYVKEFCNIEVDQDKGVVCLGLSEEEYDTYIDFDVNSQDCERLLEIAELQDTDDEIHEILSKFY